MISAIDIKSLWYADVITEKLTAANLKTLLTTATAVTNVHQDTWTIEEGEPSQDSYKDQLSGVTYRMGTKTMGDVTFNFTIGRYDYETKKELMGGEATSNSWERSRTPTEIKKSLIALTEDDVYCVLSCANVNTREANTDGAVGLAVVATMLIPEQETVSPEYWFDKSAVDSAS